MPGTCDSRPTSRPAAATWNGRCDISKHHAVSPRVVGSCRVVSTWLRDTPQASAKRIRRSTCLVPDSSSMMFSSRKSRASGSGHSPYTVAHQRAFHPLLGEGVEPAVPRVDRGLEACPERAHLAHGAVSFRPGSYAKPFRRTSGHTTITTDSARRTALTGRVTNTLTSLPLETMLVRKYASAIGPRITPITSGGTGSSQRRM